MAADVPSDSLAPIDRLRAVVHILRAPGGCPWDREQTHESLVPNLLEEAYEAAEAIRSGEAEAMREELGDLLLQVVMHGEIASEGSDGESFALDDIAAGICEKLIRRHPHVFGTSDASDTAAVLKQWDEIKRAEKGETAEPSGRLDRVGRGLPALLRAAKLQKRAAKVGFDWPDAAGVMEKIREELAETAAALAAEPADRRALEDEVGDVLFSAANLARWLKVDPESALAAANAKFTARFHAMERDLADAGISLDDATLDQMEAAWQRAKRDA